MPPTLELTTTRKVDPLEVAGRCEEQADLIVGGAGPVLAAMLDDAAAVIRKLVEGVGRGDREMEALARELAATPIPADDDGAWPHVLRAASYLRAQVERQNEELSSLRSEVERLTKERDEAVRWIDSACAARDGNLRLLREAERERDEALAMVTVDRGAVRVAEHFEAQRDAAAKRAEKAEAECARLAGERDEAIASRERHFWERAKLEAEVSRLRSLPVVEWRPWPREKPPHDGWWQVWLGRGSVHAFWSVDCWFSDAHEWNTVTVTNGVTHWAPLPRGPQQQGDSSGEPNGCDPTDRPTDECDNARCVGGFVHRADHASSRACTDECFKRCPDCPPSPTKETEPSVLAQANGALCEAIGVLMRVIEGPDPPDPEMLAARMACLKAQAAIARVRPTRNPLHCASGHLIGTGREAGVRVGNEVEERDCSDCGQEMDALREVLRPWLLSRFAGYAARAVVAHLAAKEGANG